MADTNQTNITKGVLESEFVDILKLYTEAILKEDSTLPPQNKAVYEAIKNLQDTLDKHSKTLTLKTNRMTAELKTAQELFSSKLTTTNDKLTNTIKIESDRARTAEFDLYDRIEAEKERLDAFLKGEDVEGTAIDTLKEIQRWIKDDEMGTTDLIRRVNGINATLQKEIENHRKDISSLTEQSNKADAEIIDRLDTEINNREIALDDVRNTFKEADGEITENINKVSNRVEFLEREVVLISCGNSKL